MHVEGKNLPPAFPHLPVFRNFILCLSLSLPPCVKFGRHPNNEVDVAPFSIAVNVCQWGFQCDFNLKLVRCIPTHHLFSDDEQHRETQRGSRFPMELVRIDVTLRRIAVHCCIVFNHPRETSTTNLFRCTLGSFCL